MIDYRILQFSSAPQTGEDWFVKSAQLMGLGPGFLDHAHNPFPVERNGSVYRVSLVRHPATWLAACFRIIKEETTNGHLTNFRTLNDYCFEAFIHSYLKEMPGAVGRLFDAYKADSYMRYEDLPWAFIELMRSFEIPEQFMRFSSRLGRPMSHGLPTIEPWMRKSVMNAERGVVEAYDYF